MRNGLNTYFIIPVALFVLVLVTFAVQVPYGQEFALLNGWRISPWNDAAKLTTQLGEEIAWLVAIIAVFFWSKKDGYLLLAAGLLLIPFVFAMKELYTIPRPSTFLQMHQLAASVVFVPEVELHSGRTSFPSGHTFSAFALYFLLSQIVMKMPGKRAFGVVFALFAIATGFSRVFLVQHFLVDVLAGITFGLLYGWLVLEIVEVINKK